MNSELDTDALIDQCEAYTRILKKYFSDPGLDDFLSDFGTRIAVCPRGLTQKEGGEYGALVRFLTSVAVKAKSISEGVCDTKSAVRVSLVHELGKLGDEDNELYVPQESQWHREKLGQNFKYNDNSKKMGVSHRTLYLLQKYNISLTREEWLAILTSQGMHYPENGFYGSSKTPLMSVVQFARDIAEERE